MENMVRFTTLVTFAPKDTYAGFPQDKMREHPSECHINVYFYITGTAPQRGEVDSVYQ